MRPMNPKTVRTSFGTVLGEVNPREGLFRLNRNETVLLDTPLQDRKGTEKIFIKDSTVSGTIWIEVNQKLGKQRKVVVVSDEYGRYIIPASALQPTTEMEEKAKEEISKLKADVDSLTKKAEESAAKASTSAKDFLDKKYGGFTGKQILVGAIGVIVLVKLIK